jgi:hypothetical protein
MSNLGFPGDGCRIEEWTIAIEDGAIWAVEYAVVVDAAWDTQAWRSTESPQAGLHGTTRGRRQRLLARRRSTCDFADRLVTWREYSAVR